LQLEELEKYQKEEDLSK